jgi:large subunit ribosomal protein L24
MQAANSNQSRPSLRKDDLVQVIAGRDKGKQGKVLRVNSKTFRVTVEKINLVKRHTKPTQKNPQGGIIEKEIPIHYSNVLLYCAKCARGVRHGHKLVAGKKSGEQKKVRVCKKCGQTLEAAAK